MEKVKIQCCMLSPKLWSARLFLMKLRSIVSKALQKSSCARIPGMLCIFVCSTTLSTNLIVFPPSPPPHPVSTFYKACLARLIRKPKSFLIS